MRAVQLFFRASAIRDAMAEARRLAKDKRLSRALAAADEVLSAWPPDAGGLEALVRRAKLGDALNQLRDDANRWRASLQTAQETVAIARRLRQSTSADPTDLEGMRQAVQRYAQATELVDAPDYRDEQLAATAELSRRERYVSLLTRGDAEFQAGELRLALASWEEAEKVFSTPALASRLSDLRAILVVVEGLKSRLHEAESHAAHKRLPDALAGVRAVAAEVAAMPSPAPLLRGLKQRAEAFAERWTTIVAEATTMAQQARQAARGATNPLQTDDLSRAVNLMGGVLERVADEAGKRELEAWQAELARREAFKSYLETGKRLETAMDYRGAETAYRQATQLYTMAGLHDRIQQLAEPIARQSAYEAALPRARAAFGARRFRTALAILQPVVAAYPAEEGRLLLQEADQARRGQAYYMAGLQAEKAGDWAGAGRLYMEGAKRLPDRTGCYRRMGVIAIRMENWPVAIQCWRDIPGSVGAYGLGYAQARSGDWEAALAAWRPLNHPEVDRQRILAMGQSQKRQLMDQREIETLVDAGALLEAVEASRRFVSSYGSHAVVSGNLVEHLEPRLAAQHWQGGDWAAVAATAEQAWRANPAAPSLHNLAVAGYYRALEQTDHMAAWLPVWGTAIANLASDPALEALPWLMGESPDLTTLREQLLKLVSDRIEGLRETEQSRFVALRDVWRREAMALELQMTGAATLPSKHGLKLTPGLFMQLGCDENQLPSLSGKARQEGRQLLGLYTAWGVALAACLDGDATRAAALRPGNANLSESGRYARAFVAYTEAVRLLRAHDREGAKQSLEIAKPFLRENAAWRDEIDQLCDQERKGLKKPQEHLAWAQFWFDLLGTRTARAYLAETRVDRIAVDMDEKRLTLAQGLQKLLEVERFDSDNPLVQQYVERARELIRNEAIRNELKRIDDRMDNDFEGGVRLALQSSYSEVREKVADFCMKILSSGLESEEMPIDQAYQLVSWAHDLSPDDESIEGIYDHLHAMHEEREAAKAELRPYLNLISSGRFEDAVFRARSARYETRRAVADVLFDILQNGLQNDLDMGSVRQLGLWIRTLCPQEPDFRQLYRALNL